MLAANVVLPPWIHVESSIAHRRAVRVGEAVEVHAAVAEEWERKGHRFVALDVAWRSPASAYRLVPEHLGRPSFGTRP